MGNIGPKHESANQLLNAYQLNALAKLGESPTWIKLPPEKAGMFTDFLNLLVSNKHLIEMINTNTLESMLVKLRLLSKLKDVVPADKQIIFDMMKKMMVVVIMFFNSEPITDKAKTEEIYSNINLIETELSKIEERQINKIKRQEELKTTEEFNKMIDTRLLLLRAPSVPKGAPGAASAVQKYLKYAINSEGINQPSVDKDANHLYIKYKQKYLELKKQVDNSIFN